jgi:hypothetical protein
VTEIVFPAVGDRLDDATLIANAKHLATILRDTHPGTADLLDQAADRIKDLVWQLRYGPPAVSRLLIESFTEAAIARHQNEHITRDDAALARAVVDNAARKGLIRLKEDQ